MCRPAHPAIFSQVFAEISKGSLFIPEVMVIHLLSWAAHGTIFIPCSPSEAEVSHGWLVFVDDAITSVAEQRENFFKRQETNKQTKQLLTAIRTVFFTWIDL